MKPFLKTIPILILSLTQPGLAGSQCLPQYDHVVVVIEENHSNNQILGPENSCPYLTSLAAAGANMQQSYAIEHPSEPNYLDIFTGSNQGITDDSCGQPLTVANLGSQLIAAGYTFCGYSEGLPAAGSRVCSDHHYARKHVPWAFMANLPAETNQPFKTFQALKGHYENLPTVSFVVPNLLDDMHDGSPAEGDQWLQANLGTYVRWAMSHNSLLIITWDEDDNSGTDNRIPTLFVGPGIVTGSNPTTMNHFDLLRTLEDMYRLPHAANAARATAITSVFVCH